MENPRRRRFLEWFAHTYGDDCAEARAKFMADTAAAGDKPLTKGRVSQLIKGSGEPFGENAARKLADRIGLAADYFERDHLYPNESDDSEYVISTVRLSRSEAKALEDLQEIRRLNRQSFEQLAAQVGKVAEGLRAVDQVLRAPMAGTAPFTQGSVVPEGPPANDSPITEREARATLASMKKPPVQPGVRSIRKAPPANKKKEA